MRYEEEMLPAGSDAATSGKGRRSAGVPGRGVRASLEGVALALLHLIATPIIGSRRLRWGTVGVEATTSLPGDEFVPEPKWSHTLGITIEAPPEDIWPWIAQLGQGRGGFYSYETLENMARCEIVNTTEVLAQHQHPAVGDGIRLYADGPPLRIEILEPPNALVLYGLAADIGDETVQGTSTWQFIVTAGPGGASRLLVRGRYDFGAGWKSRLMFGRFPLEVIVFVMTRKMMSEIKRLAELRSADNGAAR